MEIEMTPLPAAPLKASPRFVTTRWSLVLQAKDKAAPINATMLQVPITIG